MLTTKTVNEFITDVAAGTPTPGGGSVAALAGALGAALTAMVCSLTIGKKKYLAVQAEMEEVLKQAGSLQSAFVKLVDDDAAAFDTVMSALNLQKGTEDEKIKRTEAIQRATKSATEIPLRVMEVCEEALALTQTVAQKGNANSISDAGVAALMISAACMGARLNVKINLGSINDTVFVQQTSSRAESIGRHVEEVNREILNRVGDSLSPGHS